MDILDRIGARVNVVAGTGCWEWQGAVHTYGYGVINFNGKTSRVHRLVFQEINGGIPDGLFVLHSCDNRRCCNPDHLFLGSNDDNIADAVRRARMAHGDDHHGAKLSANAIEDVIGRLESGESQQSIAARHGVSRTQISAILSGRTWVRAVAGRAIRARRPLNPDQVREIKGLVRQGMARKAVAEQFGVSKSAVDAIMSGQNWSHIE